MIGPFCRQRIVARSLFAASGVALLFGLISDARTQDHALAEHVPGELIVKVKKSALRNWTVQDAKSFFSNTLHNALVNVRLDDIRPLATDKSIHKVKLESEAKLEEAMNALNAHPSIEVAEPNYIYRHFDLPNDPDLEKLWGLLNKGQLDARKIKGTPGSDINIVPVWNEGHTGSRDIKVAVIDTGVDWNHPELINNLYTNPEESGENANDGEDDDDNGFVDDEHGWNFLAHSRDSKDDDDHGTHCSGTIGAEGNNAQGIVGVNWKVSILPVKFLGAEGGTLEGAIESVNYARMMKVDIMSNSWGGRGYSKALEDAVKQASQAGILFVAAAGNDGTNNDRWSTYPANYDVPNVLSVAATDNEDKLAYFSNYGVKSVDVAAPGVQIYSTIRNGEFDTFSGTSMATPHVAGIAALLLSINPELTFAQLKERIIKSSQPVVGLFRKVDAWGRVNVYNAVHEIYPPRDETHESLWDKRPTLVESVHPYRDSADETYEIKYPGAKYIRVFFKQIGVESGYDVISIETPQGEKVQEITGKHRDFLTTHVKGDRLLVRLKSDLSVRDYGFLITRIEIIE